MPVRECERDTQGGFTPDRVRESQTRGCGSPDATGRPVPIPGHSVAARGVRRWMGATPPFRCPERARRRVAIHIGANAPSGRSLPSQVSLREGPDYGMAHKWRAEALERDSMKWRHAVLVLAGTVAVIWRTRYDPFPRPGDNPVLDLIAYHDPTLHAVIEAWHYGAPGAVGSGTPCATGPITSWWERCEAARRPICCKPSTPVTAGRSRPCTPTTPNPPSRAWPVAPCRPAGRSPGT